MAHSDQLFEPGFKLNRSVYENRLRQKARVIWLCGLSGSGKSTLADALSQVLFEKGFFCVLLDGDRTRMGLNKDLGFSNADREENLRRVAELCKLMVEDGIIVIASFISPLKSHRTMLRQIVGEEDFLLIYTNSSLEQCEKRDVKGLYRKARTGEIKDFTGISAPFEEPQAPFLQLNTDQQSVAECSDALLDAILPKINWT